RHAPGDDPALHRHQRLARGLVAEGVHRRDPPRVRGGGPGRRLHPAAGVPEGGVTAGGDRDRRHRHLLPHLRLERVRLRGAPDLGPGPDHAALHPLHHRRGGPGLAGGGRGDDAVPDPHPRVHRVAAQEPPSRRHLRGGEEMSAPSSATSGWPRWLRRGPMEAAATAVIAAGVIMMLQPLSMALYRHSFITTLVGTLMFTIVSKFPE